MISSLLISNRGAIACRIVRTARRFAGPAVALYSDADAKAPRRQKYDHEGNPYCATARLWDDGVIDQAQPRDVLGLTFAATLNVPIPEQAQFGIFRM
jgi:3-methylcrotonyl-CoA carboxylase beta subunit